MQLVFGNPIALDTLLRVAKDEVHGFEIETAVQDSVFIEGFSSLNHARKNFLSFCSASEFPSTFNAKGAIVIVNHKVLAPEVVEKNNTLVKTSNPRLMFIKLVVDILKSINEEELFTNYESTSVIYGKDCLIKPGAVIGQAGFGYERDRDGTPIRFPHFGSVVLGNHVEVGANTVISKGVLEDTVIRDCTKIDDLVYIAHNCKIGKNVMIAGNATLCGGVQVGDGAWIGAGASIKQNVKVGEGAVVGLGAVVVKDVAAYSMVVGNPARAIDDQAQDEKEQVHLAQQKRQEQQTQGAA